MLSSLSNAALVHWAGESERRLKSNSPIDCCNFSSKLDLMVSMWDVSHRLENLQKNRLAPPLQDLVGRTDRIPKDLLDEIKSAVEMHDGVKPKKE